MPLVTDLSLSTDQRIYIRPSRMPPRTACLSFELCVVSLCHPVCACVLTGAQPLTVTHLQHDERGHFTEEDSYQRGMVNTFSGYQ